MNSTLTQNYAFKSLNNIHEQINLNNFKNRLVFGKYNILYININGLTNKLDDLELIITEFNVKYPKKIVHFIALTETRLFDSQTLFFNLPQYTAYYCSR